MSLSNESSVYVSYAWRTPAAPAMAGLLQVVCAQHGIALQRDSDQISYGQSIRQYMQDLGAGGAIVVLISEAYLKSPNCMFELLQIEKHRHVRERVHPIILEDQSGFDFFDVLQRLEVVRYWEQRALELEAKIGSLSYKDHLPNAYEELDLCRDIRRLFDYLTGILKDMYSPCPDCHLEAEFQAVIGRIHRNLALPVAPPDAAVAGTVPALSPQPPALEPALGSAFDQALLSDLERRLAHHVGPIARYLLQAALRSAVSGQDLCERLAQRIDRPDDRRQFLAAALKAVRAGAPGPAVWPVQSPPAPAPAPAPPSPLPSAAPSSAIPPGEIERAQRALAKTVGPIARVLVQRALGQARSTRELWDLLVTHIGPAAERADFLRRRDQG